MNFSNHRMRGQKFRERQRRLANPGHSQRECSQTALAQPAFERIGVLTKDAGCFADPPDERFFPRRHSEHHITVSIEIFGSRVYNEVNSKSEGLLEVWTWKGIVDRTGDLVFFATGKKR